MPCSARLALFLSLWRFYLMTEPIHSARFRMFSVRCMFYESLPKTEREYRTCKRANALTREGGSSGRNLLMQWGSSMRKPLHFFLTSADMPQMRYLSNFRPRFITTGLASVVSWRNRMQADLSRDNSDQSQTELSSVIVSVNILNVGVNSAFPMSIDYVSGLGVKFKHSLGILWLSNSYGPHNLWISMQIWT